eukprot:3931947-Rhodomonas_salina.2
MMAMGKVTDAAFVRFKPLMLRGGGLCPVLYPSVPYLYSICPLLYHAVLCPVSGRPGLYCSAPVGALVPSVLRAVRY